MRLACDGSPPMNADDARHEPRRASIFARVLRPHPAYAPTTGWQPLPAALAAAAIIAAAPLAGDLAVRAYVWSMGLGGEGAVIPGGLAHQEAISNAIYFAALQGTFLVGALLAGVFSRRPVVEALALGPPPDGFRAYAAALLAAAAGAVAWLAALWALAPDLFAAELLPNQEMFANGPLWLTLAVFCLLAPVAEELLFRGFLFSALAGSRLGVIGAALLTTVVWTALHVGHLPHAKAQVFAAGLFLTWLLVRTASLRVPIACHVLYNLALSLALMAIPPLG